MRVEQRIGRLDRYGQASEVIHILNMIVVGHDRGADLPPPLRAHPDLRVVDRRPRGDPRRRRGRPGVAAARRALRAAHRRGARAPPQPDRRRDPPPPAGQRGLRAGEQAVPLQRRRLPRALQRHRAQPALRHARGAAAARRALPRASAAAVSRSSRRSAERRCLPADRRDRRSSARCSRAALARSGGGAKRGTGVPRPAARRGHRRHVRPGDRDGAAPARVRLAPPPDRARAGVERRPPRRSCRAAPRWRSTSRLPPSEPHGFFVFELQAHGHQGRARACGRHR